MRVQKPDTRADQELIAAVLERGDEQAFRALYRRHTPRLLGFVSRLLCGSHREDEDIVQETWIRACENLGQFQWRSAFSTWLLGIGLNVVRDSLRQNRRSRIAAEDLLSDPASPAQDHETRIDLNRAIELLPDEYRMAIVLHDIEGMTHDEIAEQLSIPIGTSKSQLFRARRMIRDRLTERNGVRR